MTTSSTTKTKARLYEASKYTAKNNLGGERAYWIAGPTVRRMAVANAILQTLFQQDEDVADSRVRTLLHDLYDLLTDDEDFA